MAIRPIKSQHEDAAEEMAKNIIDDQDYLEDDEYEYEYEEHSRLIPMIVMGVALVAFVALGWYAYNSGSEPVGEEIPFIQAEQTPVKEKPLDPGGLQFPHQDKSVFETITAEGSQNAPTEVVSSIEEPLKVQSTIPVDEAAQAAQATKPAEPAQPAATKPKEVIAAVKPKEVVQKTSPPLLKESTPAKKAQAKPVATTPARGSGIVQLAAFRSAKDAQDSWDKISAKHSVLSGLTPTIMRADLGQKGIFYRLRVSGVDAAATCAALKSAGQPCMKIK